MISSFRHVCTYESSDSGKCRGRTIHNMYEYVGVPASCWMPKKKKKKKCSGTFLSREYSHDRPEQQNDYVITPPTTDYIHG